MEENCLECGLPMNICICDSVKREAEKQLKEKEIDEPENGFGVKEQKQVGIFKALIAPKKYVINHENGNVTFYGIIQDSDTTQDAVSKGVELEVWSNDIQKLAREVLPTEEQRTQFLLDKIHNIRLERVLTVENIDKELQKLFDSVDSAFKCCQTQTDIKREEAAFKTKLAIINQKRYIAKFSIQEESELSLELAKLRHGKGS